MGFGFTACCRARGLRAMLSMRPRFRPTAPAAGQETNKIDGEALVRALLAYKRGEPRVCAMVRAPTPEDEDRRRLCRERKALTVERIQHVNRIKGLLFSQGVADYEPLRREPAPKARRTEDRRRPSVAAASQSSDQRASLIGSSCCSNRSRLSRLSETPCSVASPTSDEAPAPQAMLIGPERDRPGVRRRPMVGGALSTLCQSKAGRGLRGLGADALACETLQRNDAPRHA